MREIKFKIFDKRDKIIRPKNGVLAMIEWNQKEIPIKVGIQEYEQIDEEGNGDWCQYLFSEGEFELIQYTGIIDKNGTEIYEGDLIAINSTVEFHKNKVIEIIYELGAFCFKKEGRKHEDYTEFNTVSIHRSKFEAYLIDKTIVMEIIGNIYENPELLK